MLFRTLFFQIIRNEQLIMERQSGHLVQVPVGMKIVHFYSIFNCALLSFILYETSHIWKLIHLTLHHVNILFRTQVMDGTLTFDVDAMVFVAPNPQQADKFFALIYPLDMTVWLFILISFFIVTLAFLLLSNTEEKVKNLYHL